MAYTDMGTILLNGKQNMLLWIGNIVFVDHVTFSPFPSITS